MFGDPLLEIEVGGWVQSVKFSPSGNLIAYVGHDSSFNVADISNGQPLVDQIKTNSLPFLDVTFLNENNAVAVGHDCAPFLFQNQGGWKLVKNLDGEEAGRAASSGGDIKPSAMKAFQNKVDKGESTHETKLTTKHQNVIK